VKKYIKPVILLIICFGFGYLLRYLYEMNNNNPVEIQIKKSSNLAGINFEKVLHNFKDGKVNKELSVYFVYHNKGTDPLKINDIVTTCGCTIPIWSSKELQPGKKDSILVKYDSKLVGKFSKSIFVHHNGENSPESIKIKGRILK
jgi:hypothetical protein